MTGPPGMAPAIPSLMRRAGELASTGLTPTYSYVLIWKIATYSNLGVYDIIVMMI